MIRRIMLAFALFITAPSILFASERLIFAVDIIRHGDRTPIVALPVLSHQWSEGLGQLTAKGMQQEYNLGLAFRKKYIEQLHLLPEKYEQGTLYIRSTDYDRTLMSAQSLLTGLYPPGTGPNTGDSALSALPYGIQPIPVYSAAANHDDIIVQPVSAAERAKLLEEYVFSTNEWQQKNNVLKEKYPLWSQLTGIPINNLSDLGLIADTLYIHKLYNASMPEGLSASDAQTIIKEGTWSFMAQLRPRQVATAYSARIMTNIANFLNKGSMEKSKLKYVLLSAHDSTIASALSFLGAPLDDAPPYASNLNFSLYESGANYYVVKIMYNNHPVPIPACGGEVCELQQFVNLVSRP